MKKGLSVMLGLMLMFSMSFVVAQDPINNVAVQAGQTGTADFTTTTTQNSTTQGGLISQIVETTHSVVKMNGVVVSDKINTTKINNFSLYLFNAGATINYQNLIVGDAYQTSENVNVREVTGSWTTYKVNSTTTYPSWSKKLLLNTALSTKFNDSILATAWDNGLNKITINGQVVTLSDCATNPACPSLSALNAAFGTAGNHDRFMANYTMNGHGYPVVAYDQSGTNWFFAIDADADGTWNFQDVVITSNGYKVSAQQGQTLALIPANTYDLFAII